MDNFSTLVTNNAPRSGIAPWKSLIFSMIILGLSLMIYAGLRLGYKSSIVSTISATENRIKELERAVPREEVKKEFIQFYSQLRNTGYLLASHTAVTPFFAALEANTMEDIGFSDVRINIADKTASINGFARSYQILAGQIAVYENMSGVQKVSLISARRVNDIVGFELRIALTSDLLRLSLVTTAPATEPAQAE